MGFGLFPPLKICIYKECILMYIYYILACFLYIVHSLYAASLIQLPSTCFNFFDLYISVYSPFSDFPKLVINFQTSLGLFR
uniref:Putative ovule protein n=1 Tax=Solanum chacoense TaxID=4108 RepID=A0A0V0HFK6_SOLCH